MGSTEKVTPFLEALADMAKSALTSQLVRTCSDCAGAKCRTLQGLALQILRHWVTRRCCSFEPILQTSGRHSQAALGQSSLSWNTRPVCRGMPQTLLSDQEMNFSEWEHCGCRELASQRFTAGS